MILSVSRRTDVPSFYFDWFVNRLKEGWLLVRNPYNPTNVSRIALSPSTVECMVFWTKNPRPMLGKLAALDPYPYYVQYTINPYEKEIESRLPLLTKRIDVFRALADKLGKHRVVWRYSPIVINDNYSAGFHEDAFGRLAEALAGYTEECKISFVEMYAKITDRMRALGVVEPGDQETFALARRLMAIAESNGIALSACGKPDLRPAGIPVSSCIDGGLIERITGKPMAFRKDPGQRGVCSCVESVDIGSYHTCLNGCVYCYANHSHGSAVRKAAGYDPASPFLCDFSRPGDKIIDRSLRIHTVEPTQEQFRLEF